MAGNISSAVKPPFLLCLRGPPTPSPLNITSPAIQPSSVPGVRPLCEALFERWRGHINLSLTPSTYRAHDVHTTILPHRCIHPSLSLSLPFLQSRQDLPAKSRRSIVHAIDIPPFGFDFIPRRNIRLASKFPQKNLQLVSRVEALRGSNHSTQVRAKGRGKGWLFHGSREATRVVHFLSLSPQLFRICVCFASRDS